MPRKTKKQKRDKEPREIYEGDGHTRYPRPLGFTYTAIASKTNQEDRDKLKETVINLYINGGMQLNGKQLSIQELATFLQIPVQTMILRINKGMERISGFFEGNEGKRLARVLWQNSVLKGTEILGLIEGQTRLLLAQQGKEYVPFLSGEVNRSLGNLINAQKPIHDLLKLLIEKNPINILINGDGDSSAGGKRYISPSEAIDMIQIEGSTMYQNKDLIAAKEKTLLGLPDVSARTQDLTSIGIKRTSRELDETDSSKESSTDIRHHEHHNQVPNTEDFNA